MAEFQVTASTLKQKAEELSTLNNNFAKKVEELMASEKSLSGMWEGQAKEAFENAFNTDAGKKKRKKNDKILVSSDKNVYNGTVSKFVIRRKITWMEQSKYQHRN